MKKGYYLSKILLSIFIFLVLSINQVQGRYEIGDVVGDFTLPSCESGDVSLYDYTNKVILLNFWTHY